jgi:hypothetical protein
VQLEVLGNLKKIDLIRDSNRRPSGLKHSATTKLSRAPALAPSKHKNIAQKKQTYTV